MKPVITSLFNRALLEIGLKECDHRCFSPVIYNYWISESIIGCIDKDRLLEELRTGDIKRRRGFGATTIGILRKRFKINET